MSNDPQGNDRTAYTSAYPSKRDSRVEKNLSSGGKSEPQATQQNVGSVERWLSLGLGAGLFLGGLNSGRLPGILAAIAGGALIFRGMTGNCQLYQALGMNTARKESTAVPAQAGFKVEEKILVQRPPEELYRYWRNLENLPSIMDHLREVKEIGGNRSHWVAETAIGEIAWDAEVFNEREPEMIAWRSVPGSLVDTAGSVRFRQLHPSGHTEVTVSLKYNPPIGAQIEAWLSGSLDQRIQEDLRRFKQTMESAAAPQGKEFAGV